MADCPDCNPLPEFMGNATCALPPGTYQNATVVVGPNGCITQIAAGDRVLVNECDPCTAPTTGGGGGGSGGTDVSLDPSPANLTTLPADNVILTTLAEHGTAPILISGNGTPASPLVVSIDPTASFMAGANVNYCGIDIENGIVKAFPGSIIETITNTSDAITVTTTGCAVTIANGPGAGGAGGACRYVRPVPIPCTDPSAGTGGISQIVTFWVILSAGQYYVYNTLGTSGVGVGVPIPYGQPYPSLATAIAAIDGWNPAPVVC